MFDSIISFPSATETENPSWLKLNNYPEFFYEGDCNDPNVQTKLKESFLNDILRSPKVPPFFCILKPECNMNSVEVFCGATTTPERRRKRRSVMKVWDWWIGRFSKDDGIPWDNAKPKIIYLLPSNNIFGVWSKHLRIFIGRLQQSSITFGECSDNVGKLAFKQILENLGISSESGWKSS